MALRVWASRWRDRRVRLTIKGDSVAMLTTVLHMRASTAHLGLIAREVALDTAESVFEPDVVVHIPGVANDLADSLSRRTAPSQTAWHLPPPLSAATEAIAPPRDDSYSRTI